MLRDLYRNDIIMLDSDWSAAFPFPRAIINTRARIARLYSELEGGVILKACREAIEKKDGFCGCQNGLRKVALLYTNFLFAIVAENLVSLMVDQVDCLSWRWCCNPEWERMQESTRLSSVIQGK